MKIKVPATSANLGCGFDTLGLALDLYNEFTLEPARSDRLEGEARDPGRHMVFTACTRACSLLGLPRPAFRLKVRAQVPESRGLGSSATCILAGAAAALWLNGQPVNEEKMLALASAIEGHPDNVVPAFTGGLTASLCAGERVLYRKFRAHGSLIFLAVIPPYEFATSAARAAIPEMVRHRDAVYNLSRVILLADALEKGDVSYLGELFKDELHQQYRLPLIHRIDPGYEKLMETARQNCAGVYLSGAGPAFIAVVKESDASEHLAGFQKAAPGYRVLALKADNEGTKIED